MVLFIEQEHLSKFGLVRLRFNSTDGSLIEEKVVAESKSISKRTECYVMKNRGEEGYAILLFTDDRAFQACKATVQYYNAQHETVKEVELKTDRKNYDYVSVTGAEIQPNGICVSLTLSKIVENGTAGSAAAGGYGMAELSAQYLAVYYIPTGDSIALKRIVDVTTNVNPYYTNYTYNPFARSLNLLLLSYRELSYQAGLIWEPYARMANLFFKLDEENMAVNIKVIKNHLATSYLQEKTETRNVYQGIPARLFTNENGLSTLVSEYCYREGNLEKKFGKNSYLGHIGITQFDDDGNEIWGIVLPKAQFYISQQRYYSTYEVSKKWQGQVLFDDAMEAAYNRQFVSMNTYYKDKDFYFIYNDVNKNFNNSISHVGDTVYSFDQTNTCYYKISRKKEVTKNYLFGEPAADEFKTSFIEGADFDEQRGVYAALVRCKKGDDVALRMAWRHLD